MKPDKCGESFVYGHHTVVAVMQHQPARAKKLFIARADGADDVKQLAKKRGLVSEQVDRGYLEKRFNVGSDAQGLVLVCSPFSYVELNTATLSATDRILVLDSWQDAANLGRAARAALSFAAGLIIIGKDRSVQVSAAAEKSAVGALAQIPVARVTNLSAAIQKIKDAGFFVYGADERGSVDIKQCDFARKAAIVIGQEGEGLRELTKKNCDVLVSIPMAKADICLNAADTALVFLYELSRREETI